MSKLYIGIDPGDKGGVVVLYPDKPPILHKMPLIEDEELDIIKIFEYLDQPDYEVHVAIENVHSIFGSSASSNWKFGFDCGQLFALLKISGIPFTKVTPKSWQKVMWEGVKPVLILDKDKKNKDGSQKYKIDTKATSTLAALRLYPNVNFKPSKHYKNDHDGLIDAILIATYAKRKNF